MMLTPDSPKARARSLAASITTIRVSTELAIRSADDQHKPVPPIIRMMPANLSAWAKIVQSGGTR